MILETRLVIRNIRDIRNGRTPRSCPPPTCSSALGKCNSSQSLCPGSATKYYFPELSSNTSPGCNEDNRGFHNPVSSIWQSGWDQLSSPELKITNDLVSIYYFYDKKVLVKYRNYFDILVRIWIDAQPWRSNHRAPWRLPCVDSRDQRDTWRQGWSKLSSDVHCLANMRSQIHRLTSRFL